MVRIEDCFIENFPARESQLKALKDIEANWDKYDVFVLGLPTACHLPGEKILMADGSVKLIEQIKIGDYVMGDDGGKRLVLNLHHGEAEAVELTTKEGRSYHLTKDHVLVLENLHRFSQNGRRLWRRGIVETTVREWETWSKSKKYVHMWYRVGIEDLGNTMLSIDPYVLGLWLGDGTSDGVALTTMDFVVKDAFTEECERLGDHLSRVWDNGSKALTYHFAGNNVRSILKSYNLLGNKHIPPDYLYTSRENRLKLLAGIIDTDGYVDTHGRTCEIVQKRRILIEQIEYLVLSLGFGCSVIKTKYVNNVPYYRIFISGNNVSSIPTKLPHKKLINSKRDCTRHRFAIKDIGRKEFYGITVDGNNRYLLSDFSVTHNCGKSAISMTIMRWASKQHKKKSAWIVPNNLLVEQIHASYPRLHVLRRKSAYECICNPGFSCEDIHAKEGGHCSLCPYIKAVRTAHATPYMLCNTYSFTAHKLYKPVQVFDEAHELIKLAQDRAARKLWYHEYGFPTGIATYGALLRWVESHPKIETDKKLKLLREELQGGKHKYLVEKSLEPYRNRADQLVLKLKPIDVADKCDFLWSKRGKNAVEKIILMSATISSQDIKDLGLSSRRVAYINAPSPIPKERRPTYIEPLVKVSHLNMSESASKAASYIKEVLANNPEKGIIHAPYQYALKLKEHLLDEDRIIVHDQGDKKDKYEEFYNSPPGLGKVIIGSGMETGLDLKYDIARWQIITKVPYPSLEDPAIRFRAEKDRMWYNWKALQLILQAMGRVCRSDDDFGATIIIDKAFQRLYDETKELIPEWAKEALVWE